MAIGYVTTLRNAMLDQITSTIGNAGLLRIYDGTRPATGGAATTLIAQLTGGTPWAPASSAAQVTANSITGANASASSTATWFRWTTSGGTAVMDGNVGTSGSDLNLTTTTVVSGQPVSVTSFVITEGNP